MFNKCSISYTRLHRGQSTVEYIMLVTAVIVVAIVFLTNPGQGGFHSKLKDTVTGVSAQMVNVSKRLTDAM